MGCSERSESFAGVLVCLAKKRQCSELSFCTLGKCGGEASGRDFRGKDRELSLYYF